MLISIYTSRVILNTLGIEDYGINNVVGGVVALFSFINNAMIGGTQRFIIFALGKNNYSNMQRVFTTSFIIHLTIALLLLLLSETIGLYFVTNHLNIPSDRIEASLWVYQLSIFSTIVMILNVPFNATIIAHEKMNFYAYISIIEVSLKLVIVYLLQLSNHDKLKLYAILLFTIQLLITSIYIIYCRHKFHETRIQLIWDYQLYKEMACFAGWNLWGNCAYVTFTQGINILLNIFFGPSINAARGIALQIQNSVIQFSNNFQTAINPQITKSYATEDYKYMHLLIYKSSKFTFFLLFILSLPIIMEIDLILKIWLENVPAYTNAFTRLILCISIIEAMSNPLMISISATGKIKRYQLTISMILFTILPTSYIILSLGGHPTSVFITHFIISIIAFFFRLKLIAPMIHLSIKEYFNNVITKCLLVIISTSIFPILIKILFSDSIIISLITILTCILCSIIIIYKIGMDNFEQEFIREKIKSIIKQNRDRN